MDSLTQIVLGASVGYSVAGKSFGKKALLLGALAGTLPDLDFIPTLGMDSFAYLKHHRGFSHSLLFCGVGPAIVGFLTKKLVPKIDAMKIFWIFFWGILTHILLDCFTSWGTQVLWPFPERVAWNAIFIIDPGYSLPLLGAVVAALFFSKHARRKRWVIGGLILSSLYLGVAVGIKQTINTRFEKLFSDHGIQVNRYTSRPSPFNILLWSANAETDDGYYYGMISIFDTPVLKPLYFVPKRHKLAKSFDDKNSRELLQYTKGYYSVEPTPIGIVIRDLRYGFMGDPWLNGENFVFSYYLSRDEQQGVQLTIKTPRPNNTAVLLKQLWMRLKGA